MDADLGDSYHPLMGMPDSIARLAAEFPVGIEPRGDDCLVVDIPVVTLGWRGLSREAWREAKCVLPRDHIGPCEPAPDVDFAAKQVFLDALQWPLDDDRVQRIIGRPRSIFFDQSQNNWVEIVTATWLVEALGIRAADLVNEVFHLSSGSSSWRCAQSAPRPSDGEYARGTRTVARLLPATFFSGFAAMIDANCDRPCFSCKDKPRIDAHGQKGHDINVDLFAADAESAALIEVKYDDSVKDHQVLALAMAAVAAQGAGKPLWTAIIRVDESAPRGQVVPGDPYSWLLRRPALAGNVPDEA